MLLVRNKFLEYGLLFIKSYFWQTEKFYLHFNSYVSFTRVCCVNCWVSIGRLVLYVGICYKSIIFRQFSLASLLLLWHKQTKKFLVYVYVTPKPYQGYGNMTWKRTGKERKEEKLTKKTHIGVSNIPVKDGTILHFVMRLKLRLISGWYSTLPSNKLFYYNKVQHEKKKRKG